MQCVDSGKRPSSQRWPSRPWRSASAPPRPSSRSSIRSCSDRFLSNGRTSSCSSSLRARGKVTAGAPVFRCHTRCTRSSESRRAGAAPSASVPATTAGSSRTCSPSSIGGCTSALAGKPSSPPGELVSGTYFPALGVRPALGRLFTPKDDQVPGGHSAAILSHAYWQTRFAGEPSVSGREITINGHPFTIIGVAEAGFSGINLANAAQVFVPMMMKAEMTPGWNCLDDERCRFAQVFGRLRPGVMREQAQARLQPSFRALRERELTDSYFARASDYTKRQFLETRIELAPGDQGYSEPRGPLTQPLWLLLAIAGGVLLIACANVAGLFVARGLGRQREVAIRLTVGASRWRVIQPLLAESVVLASLGALGGLLLASWGTTLLLRLLLDAESSVSVTGSPDARVLAFTAGVALATGVVFGLVPAWQVTQPSLGATLKDQSLGVVGGGPVRLRKALVVAQVALSVLLLTGAGLFVRSLRNLAAQDPGFVTRNLVSFDVEASLSGYSGAHAQQFYKTLVERVSALPGVTSVALTLGPLLQGEQWSSGMTVEGYAAEEGEDVRVSNNAVTPGYFETMGIPLLSGRDFTPQDARLTPPGEGELSWVDGFSIAIANQRFVDVYFEGKNPIGGRVGFGGDPGTPTPIEIVGVVENAKSEGLREDVRPQLFFPFLESADPMRATVHVQTRQAPEAIFPLLRRTAREIEPDLPLLNMATMERQVERSLRGERLVAALSSVFAALATLLAVIGLYGVMAYTVMRRTREIGIRMALGALSSRVAWLFLREAVSLVLVGFGVALPVIWALARYVESLLYGVEPLDPITIAVAMLGLGVVAAAGALVPAVRAARIHPLMALREE
ncbi:MAG: FtsX-like permease family protein [Luteitalea sp.]|nr:FtsX-like permease family protein [Luteitalea sp.]